MHRDTDRAAAPPRVLYLLVGPKGAGKSHIGRLALAHTDIHFISVEPIWLALQPGEDGWRKVAEAIAAAFETHPKVMIETLGAGDAFQAFHAALATRYALKYIRVYADPATCLARVRARSQADHLPVSAEQVAAYNRIAARVSFPWDLELDNSQPVPDADLIALLRRL
jgi:shikimate kinase